MSIEDKIRESLKINRKINGSSKDYCNFGFRKNLKIKLNINDLSEIYYYHSYFTMSDLYIFVKNENEIICEDSDLQTIIDNFDKYNKLILYS